MGNDPTSVAAKGGRKPAKKAAASTGTSKQPKKPGRPSAYTQEIADLICARIAEGEPLRQICRDEGMPHWTTVYEWQKAHEEFSLRIAHARELGEEAIAQDCLKIADDGWNDTYIDDKGNKRTDTDVIQRSKLRIETRLKLLAKWNPRKWGEKVDLNHGGQKDNPIMALLAQVSGTALPVVKDDDEE